MHKSAIHVSHLPCLLDELTLMGSLIASLIALVLGKSVAAALQFIAKALACMPLRLGDFQFNQSYFDCN